MARLKLVVLISGRGSNLQALIDACAAPEFPARIVGVISNRPNAAGLKRASDAGIDTAVIHHPSFPDREAFEQALDDGVRTMDAELICLAGFMRLLSADFVNAWHDKLINIHPSLLPAFRGLDAQRQALAAGVRISGCTVHYVRPDMDDGPIILQAAVPVTQTDTAETLAARILTAEHKCYPAAVKLIAEGRVRIDGRRVEIENGAASTMMWLPES